MRVSCAWIAAFIVATGCTRTSSLGRRHHQPAGGQATTIVAEPPPAAEATRPTLPAGRTRLVAEGGNGVEVYPPLKPPETTASLVVFLHATCMQPVDVCDFWNAGGRDGTFLVCPAGPARCAGEPDWAGTPKVKAAALEAALSVVDTQYAAFIDHEKGDVLMGYSRGAFAARDILYEGTRHFRGMILLSASLSPDSKKLRAAGIKRAVLATGEMDGSRATMLRAVDKLNADGLPTRFVSLGRVGHWLPRNLEDLMRDAIAWVQAPDA